MTREEAMEILNNTAFFGRSQDDIDNAIDMAIEALKQESVIHAKWERGYSFPDGEYWKCLHCNELIKVKIPMHYCNNCGAKMDKE